MKTWNRFTEDLVRKIGGVAGYCPSGKLEMEENADDMVQYNEADLESMTNKAAGNSAMMA